MPSRRRDRHVGSTDSPWGQLSITWLKTNKQTDFWFVKKNLFTEAKPARTISIISGGLKNDFAEIDRWEFVKGISRELPGEISLKKTCNFSVNNVSLFFFRLSDLLVLYVCETLICELWSCEFFTHCKRFRLDSPGLVSSPCCWFIDMRQQSFTGLYCWSFDKIWCFL